MDSRQAVWAPCQVLGAAVVGGILARAIKPTGVFLLLSVPCLTTLATVNVGRKQTAPS